MYRNHFNVMDDEEAEDRPVLPSISRIFDNNSSRAPSSLRLPPLPANEQGQHGALPRLAGVRPDNWPPVPVSNNQEYSSRAAGRGMYNYPANTMSEFPRDPRISALETNQAMSALASVRSAPAIQYSSVPYGDPQHNRESTFGSHSAGHRHGGGYDSMYDPRSSTGYTGRHHTVDNTHNMRDSSSNTSSRPLYDQRSSDNSSSSSARHRCNICGHFFSRPSGLRIHMTIHTGEKPYVCPEEGCHRSFSVRSNMRRHVRIVHQSTVTSEGSTDSSEDGDSRGSREEE